ncbi:hypothetical protein CRE_16905 [Caenorhabditis remanei]|uniref:Uncharacterized protein n=1 Tax=Caenorhabditis remanei TaxID=31234 RepID=E3MSB3_CAERE|nr:hypothetical protein CRE_16905 [Caenorhabditis remanei]
MGESDPILFFAARRGFYTDGVSFLVIVGLSPHEDKFYRVTERKLTEKGIQLGQFLMGTVVSTELVKDFQLTNYPLDVEIDGNVASVSFGKRTKTHKNHIQITLQSDSLVPSINGTHGFKTKPFGIVRALDKSIQPGSYTIKITAKSSSFSKGSPLCAAVVLTTDSQLPSETSSYVNYHHASARSSSTNYSTISMQSRNHLNDSENGNQPSSNSQDPDSMDDLIARLPKLKPPLPLPRTVKPIINTPSNANSENKIVGSGFAVKVPELPKRNMTAFVTNIHDASKSRLYFLWICDVQEEGMFFSNRHELDRGHFFEGTFVKQEKGKQEWKCIRYLRKADELVQGSVVRDKIELTLPVLSYELPSDPLGKPNVYAEHIGKIVDRNNRLPANCIGKNITVQRSKNNQNVFEWIVTGMLENENCS